MRARRNYVLRGSDFPQVAPARAEEPAFNARSGRTRAVTAAAAQEALSVWLMPEPVLGRELAGIVRELAGRFATPVFEPHLTIIGGRAFDLRDLSRAVGAAVGGMAPMARPVLDVVTGEAFFRSFYALFGAEGVLADLKRRTDQAAGLPAATDFMPHISLLYGPVEAGPKAAAAAEIRKRLKGRVVRFDRVEIVRSGDDVPIADWATIETFPLAG